MITAEQIPPEVVEELCSLDAWRGSASEARAAIAAALAAWPGAQRVKGYFTHDTDYYEPAFILPLPQEARDE